MATIPKPELDGKVGAFHLLYEDYMESRALSLDAEDSLCICGHPWSFHVSFDMRMPQPCDAEICANSRVYSDDSKLCGCAYFQEAA